MKQFSVDFGKGRYRIEINALDTGEGITCSLTGGEKPHVGAVVMSIPKKGPGQDTGCDSWVIPVPGHKDAEAAKPAAELICRATGKVTVVSAGIHIDNAGKNEIEILLKNSMEAVNSLVEKLSSEVQDA